MSQNNLRSQSLDLLRFPLAIVVVTVHMFSARVGLDGSQFNADAELDLSLKGLLSCFWYYNGTLMSIPGAVMLYAGTELAVVLSLLALFAFMRRYCPGLLKVMTGRK